MKRLTVVQEWGSIIGNPHINELIQNTFRFKKLNVRCITILERTRTYYGKYTYEWPDSKYVSFQKAPCKAYHFSLLNKGVL